MAKQNWVTIESDDKSPVSFTAAGKTVKIVDLPQASLNKILSYGIKQYIGDGAAGPKDQSQADKESGVAERVANLIAGTFATTRTVGSKAMTAESVAADMVRASAKAKNVKVTAEQIKKLVVQLRDDEAKWAKVLAELARRESEEIDFELDF